MTARVMGVELPEMRGPRVVTPIPGAESARLLARQEQRESNARTYPRRLPIAISRAQGPFVEDADGNVLIDFLSGAGAVALGHNHPEVVRALRGQLDVSLQTLDFPTPLKDEFTSAQLSMLPAAMRDRMKVHFCGPTGANAVEAAVKLCKAHTGRAGVVSFQGGYHGSTHLTMALSGGVGPRERVGNLVPGVHHFPFSSCYRCPLGLRPEGCNTNCVGLLEHSLEDPLGGIPRPAAVILELVQAEGGVFPATAAFAQEVRRITHELDIPLIADEVQTGAGRTGTWFAFEQFGIEPDVIVASKGLGAIGLPIAILLYDRGLDTWAPGAHTGTFRGNQLAFAAGLAGIEVVRRERLLENVVAQGEHLGTRLRLLAGHFPVVGDVRGRGLLWGIEIVDRASGRGDPERATRVQRQALERGLLAELVGRGDCVLKLLPPLNVTRQVLDAAVDILEAALAAASR